SIPHGFEVEGQGIEKEIETIQPGATDTLTLTLKPGTYEVYCPVGEDSHKKLGMETHLKVAGVTGSGSSGYGASEMRDSHESMSDSHETMAKVQAIRVTSGGPVIQILPGPFPFPDRAAPTLQAFGDEHGVVQVVLLSRAGGGGDCALACWDRSKNESEELQLQVHPGPGEPRFDAPGGFLFVSWEKPSPRTPTSHRRGARPCQGTVRA